MHTYVYIQVMKLVREENVMANTLQNIYCKCHLQVYNNLYTDVTEGKFHRSLPH